LYAVSVTGYDPVPGNTCVGLFAVEWAEPSPKFHEYVVAPTEVFVKWTENVPEHAPAVNDAKAGGGVGLGVGFGVGLGVA
jgi:hypothetical protein